MAPRTALLLLLAATALAGADDDAAKARFAARIAALPAPSEAETFRFDGEAVMNGQVLGTWSLGVGVVEGRWVAAERVVMGRSEYSVERHTEVRLDRDLSPVSGLSERRAPGERFLFTFRRGQKGFDFRVTGANGLAKDVEVPHEGHALATLTSVLLFARLSTAAPGSYLAMKLNTGPPVEGTGPIEPTRIELAAKGRWRGSEAFLATADSASGGFTAAFDPATRALLGFRVRNGAVEMEVLPRGTVTSTIPVDVFDKPARSPAVAAARAYLALMVNDMALLGRCVHWPTVYEEGTSPGEGRPTPERYRATVLAVLGKSLPKRPRGEVEPFLRAAIPVLEVKPAGENRATVTFPESLKGRVFEVGLFDGRWLLTNLAATRAK